MNEGEMETMPGMPGWETVLPWLQEAPVAVLRVFEAFMEMEADPDTDAWLREYGADWWARRPLPPFKGDSPSA